MATLVSQEALGCSGSVRSRLRCRAKAHSGRRAEAAVAASSLRELLTLKLHLTKRRVARGFGRAARAVPHLTSTTVPAALAVAPALTLLGRVPLLLALVAGIAAAVVKWLEDRISSLVTAAAPSITALPK